MLRHRKDPTNAMFGGEHTIWSTGEATDQDMLAPDCSPIHPGLLTQSRFKACLRPGYFLLESLYCMLEICMLLASDEGPWVPVTLMKALKGGSGGLKTLLVPVIQNLRLRKLSLSNQLTTYWVFEIWTWLIIIFFQFLNLQNYFLKQAASTK